MDFSSLIFFFNQWNLGNLSLISSTSGRVVTEIDLQVKLCVQRRSVLNEFRMSGLPMLSKKLENFLSLLVEFYHLHI